MKPTSGTSSSEGRFKSIFLFILRIAVACGILAWIIHGDVTEVIDEFRSIDLSWLLLALVLYGSHLLIGSLRWYLLIRVQNIQISFLETLSLWMQGFFFSLVIPGGSIGGDLIKAKFLSSRTSEGKKLEATFTILVDRIVGLMGMFSVAAVFIAVNYHDLIEMSSFNQSIIGAISIAVFIGLGASIFIFFHRMFDKIPGVGGILSFVDSKTGGMVNRLMSAMDFYRSAYKRIIALTVLTIVFIHLNLGLIGMCIGHGISEEPPTLNASITAITLGNVAALVPGTQGGVGTRDYVIKSVYDSAAVAETEAKAMTLIFTAIILSFNILGGIFYIFPVKSTKLDKDTHHVEA